jgi:hypothetical protein
MSPKPIGGGKRALKKLTLKASSLRPPSVLNDCRETSARPFRRFLNFCKRNATLCLFPLVLIAPVLQGVLRGTMPSDVREIDAKVAELTFSAEQEAKQLHEVRASRSTSRKILVVGMVESLEEFWENEPVWVAISQICWANTVAESSTGTVNVHVLYKSKNREIKDSSDRNDSGDGDLFLTQLTHHLTGYGCQATFLSEDELWDITVGKEGKEHFLQEFKQLSRYKRMGKLRSHQRRQILEAEGPDAYEVVINVDMDMVSLPPVVPLLKVIDRVAQQDALGIGSIVCSNGFENWVLGHDWMIRPLFYDTMAAVDVDGNWGYTTYTTDVRQVVGFGQALLLRDILRQYPNLWPMQSCFGGVGLYDMSTWATPECDYDLDAIQLLTVPIAMSDGDRIVTGPAPVVPGTDPTHDLVEQKGHFQLPPAQRWTLDPKYTLTGKPNGDACEHVVFQQCLYDANHQRANNGDSKRTLNIGIQPELVIQRQAAIMNRWEDIFNIVTEVGRVVLVATGMALMAVPILRCLLQMLHGDSKTRSDKKVDKHGHDA